MQTKDLVSTRKLGHFTVDYYITFSHGTVGESGPSYGISIEKREGENVESYDASCCFYEYSPAYALAEKLARHAVTPIGAEETIEVILESFSR